MFVTVSDTLGVSSSSLGSFTVNPGELRIVDDMTAAALDPAHIHYKAPLSQFLGTPRPPKSWNKKRVLLWRRAGLGDQLILIPTVHFLEAQGATVYVTCFPWRDFWDLWLRCLPNSGHILAMPVSLDCVWSQSRRPFFDVPCFLEYIYERFELHNSMGVKLTDEKDSDYNVYDRQYSILGFDPETIDPSFKRPHFPIAKGDVDARQQWLEHISTEEDRDLSGGYIAIQPAASVEKRSIPIPVLELILQTLHEVCPEFPVLVLQHKPSPDVTEVATRNKAIDCAGLLPSFASFASVIAGARLAITPDSSGCHIAAAVNTPLLTLHATHHPDRMIQYYPLAVGIHCPSWIVERHVIQNAVESVLASVSS